MGLVNTIFLRWFWLFPIFVSIPNVLLFYFEKDLTNLAFMAIIGHGFVAYLAWINTSFLGSPIITKEEVVWAKTPQELEKKLNEVKQ